MTAVNRRPNFARRDPLSGYLFCVGPHGGGGAEIRDGGGRARHRAIDTARLVGTDADLSSDGARRAGDAAEGRRADELSADLWPYVSTTYFAVGISDKKFKPLIDAGYHTLVDVEAFQSARGLTADGIIGPDTWAALLRYRDARVNWIASGGQHAVLANAVRRTASAAGGQTIIDAPVPQSASRPARRDEIAGAGGAGRPGPDRRP